MKSRRGKARSTRSLNAKKSVGRVNTNIIPYNEENGSPFQDQENLDNSFNEVSDLPSTANGQKKLSRKELKAFLKQGRKGRIVVDEKFISTMEDLTDLMNKNCSIDNGIKRIKRFIPIIRSAKLMSPQRGRKKKTVKDKSNKIPNNPSWCPLVLPNDDGLLKLFNIPDNVNEVDPAQLHPGLIVNSDYHNNHAKPFDRFSKLSNHRVNRYLNNIDNLINISITNNNSTSNPILLNVNSAVNSPSTKRANLASTNHSKCSDSYQSTPEMSNASSSVASETDSLRSKKVRNNNKAETGKKSVQRELKGLVTWASLVAAEEKGLTSGYVVKNEESLKQTLDLQVSSDNNSDTGGGRTRRASLASGNSHQYNKTVDSENGEDAKSQSNRKTPLSIPSPISETSSNNNFPLPKQNTKSTNKTIRSRGNRKTNQSTISRKALQSELSGGIGSGDDGVNSTISTPGGGKKTPQMTINPQSMNLPPRKRYKTQQQSNSNNNSSSNCETVDILSEQEDNTIQNESFDDDQKKPDEENALSSQQLDNSPDNHPQHKDEDVPMKTGNFEETSSRRKRGRPSRIPEEPAITFKISKPSAGRPKREAAQIGYANIVSGSINSGKPAEIDEEIEIVTENKPENKSPVNKSCSVITTEEHHHQEKSEMPQEMVKLTESLALLQNPIMLRKSHSVYRKYLTKTTSPDKPQTSHNLSSNPVISHVEKATAIQNFTPISTFSMFENSSMKMKPLLMKRLEEIYSTSIIYPLMVDLLNVPVPDEPNNRLFSPVLILPSYRKYPELHRFFSQCPIPKNSPLSLEKLVELFTDKENVISTNHQYHVQNIPVMTQDLGHIMPILDQCIETLLITWEAFAGRKSWLGRQLILMRTSYYELRKTFLTKLSTSGNTSAKELLKVSTFAGGALSKIGSSLLTTPILFGNTSKKKLEKRQFEKGCEVVRCLCGFRVEGGHLMVQCDLCASWQHLPCLWWAINAKIHPKIAKDVVTSPLSKILSPDKQKREKSSSNTTETEDVLTLRCRDALEAAMSVGLGDSSHRKTSTFGNIVDSEMPYICTSCLGIDDLTMDYPQNLANAMMVNDLNLVFQDSRLDKSPQVEFNYWSLYQSPEENLISCRLGDLDQCSLQLRTDDYIFIPKKLWNIFREANFEMKDSHSDFTKLIANRDIGSEDRLLCDNIIIRVYRLWKTRDGRGWFEGGAFLRPYDLGHIAREATHKWHCQEVIYDEANKIVMPIEYARGRCVVLSPSSYKVGRPFEISCPDEAFIDDVNPFVYVCEKIITTSDNSPDQVILDEIEPGYLKVLQKPYCFLKHSEVSSLRVGIVHDKNSDEILSIDKQTKLQFYSPMPLDVDRGNSRIDDPSTVFSTSCGSEKKSDILKDVKKRMSLPEILQKLKAKTKLTKRLKSTVSSLAIFKKSSRKSLTVVRKQSTLHDLTKVQPPPESLDPSIDKGSLSRKRKLSEKSFTTDESHQETEPSEPMSSTDTNTNNNVQVPNSSSGSSSTGGGRRKRMKSTKPKKILYVEDEQQAPKSSSSPHLKENFANENSIDIVISTCTTIPFKDNSIMITCSKNEPEHCVQEPLFESIHIERSFVCHEVVERQLVNSFSDVTSTLVEIKTAQIASTTVEEVAEKDQQDLNENQENPSDDAEESTMSNNLSNSHKTVEESNKESLNHQNVLETPSDTDTVMVELKTAQIASINFEEEENHLSNSFSEADTQIASNTTEDDGNELINSFSDVTSTMVEVKTAKIPLNTTEEDGSHLVNSSPDAETVMVELKTAQIASINFEEEESHLSNSFSEADIQIASNTTEDDGNELINSFSDVTSTMVEVKTAQIAYITEEEVVEKSQEILQESQSDQDLFLSPAESPSGDVSFCENEKISTKESESNLSNSLEKVKESHKGGEDDIHHIENDESTVQKESDNLQASETDESSTMKEKDSPIQTINPQSNEEFISSGRQDKTLVEEMRKEKDSSEIEVSPEESSQLHKNSEEEKAQIENLESEDEKSKELRVITDFTQPIIDGNAKANTTAIRKSDGHQKLGLSPLPELNFSDPFDIQSPDSKMVNESENVNKKPSLDITDSPPENTFQLVSYSDEEEDSFHSTGSPRKNYNSTARADDNDETKLGKNFLISDDI